MDAVSLREKIGGDWYFRGGAWWRLEPIAGIRTIAGRMLEGEARFATIVATSGADRSLRVSWHWDVLGTLLSVESLLSPGGLMPTVADIYPGADWAERETVRRALEAANGIKKDAAESMGISQRALSYYLAKYRIE